MEPQQSNATADDDDFLTSGSSSSRGSAGSAVWRPSGIVRYLPKEVQPIYTVILNGFRLGQTERDILSKIVSQGVQANIRLRDRDGLPVQWCYVPVLPILRVMGYCLALQLCTSDNFFRVALYDFHGHQKSVQPDSLTASDNRIFILPKAMRRTTMEVFCEHIATCVKTLLQENDLLSKKAGSSSTAAPNNSNSSSSVIYMGLVAGFSMKVKSQRSPVSAVVVSCRKDYRMTNFIGNDFVPYLGAAFKKLGLNIEVGTVVNDTVAVLLAGIHHTSCHLNTGIEDNQADCSISVVCNRTETNIAYLENDKEFLESFLNDERSALRRPMGLGYCAVVNTEAGYYIGAKGELSTVANTLESETSELVNAPLRLESVSSGAWYPHLLKRVIKLLTVTKIINMQLDSNWTLEDSTCFEVFTVCDRWQATLQVKKRLDSNLASELQKLLGINSLTPVCAGVIAEVCNAMVCRSAEFTAIGIMAIANRIYSKMFPKQMVIAYGGTMFTAVSQFKDSLQSALNAIMLGGTEIVLLKSDEALGSAITALTFMTQQQ